jgi:hypothetical protein
MIIDDEGRAYSSFVLARFTLVMKCVPKESGYRDVGLHFSGTSGKKLNQKRLIERDQGEGVRAREQYSMLGRWRIPGRRLAKESDPTRQIGLSFPEWNINCFICCAIQQNRRADPHTGGSGAEVEPVIHSFKKG